MSKAPRPNEKPCERDAVEFLKREHDFWYYAEWGGVKKELSSNVLSFKIS